MKSKASIHPDDSIPLHILSRITKYFVATLKDGK